MGVSLLEHRGNDNILGVAKVEPIGGRLQWFGKTEIIRAGAEMKMEEKQCLF